MADFTVKITDDDGDRLEGVMDSTLKLTLSAVTKVDVGVELGDLATRRDLFEHMEAMARVMVIQNLAKLEMEKE